MGKIKKDFWRFYKIGKELGYSEREIAEQFKKIPEYIDDDPVYQEMLKIAKAGYMDEFMRYMGYKKEKVYENERVR